MKPIIYYIYDAHCGWCYGFSEVMKKLFGMYNNVFQFKVISGELIPRNEKQSILVKAEMILNNYEHVTNTTGLEFSDKYLSELRNPNSTIMCESMMPALALQAVKEYYPNTAFHFANAFQKAHYQEGLDLSLLETYKGLAGKFLLVPDDFANQIMSEGNRQLALAEMDFCKKLQINSYPCLLFEEEPNSFSLIQNGYAPYQNVADKIDAIIQRKGL